MSVALLNTDALPSRSIVTITAGALGLPFVQFLFEDFIYCTWTGVALRELHYVPYEKADNFLIAFMVFGDLLFCAL